MQETNLDQIINEAIREVMHSGKKCGCGKCKMTLASAKRIVSAVEKKAESMHLSAVVAIVSESARPVLVECMDGAYIASYDIAVNKAYTSAALKMPTAALKQLAQPGGSLYGIQHTNGGKIVVFGGGEPLEHDGGLVGAIGVSGGTEEQDMMLAQYGKSIFEQELS